MTWTETRLKHLCIDAGQYGLNVSANDYSPTGYRLIRTSDIDESGKLRPRDNAVFIDTKLDDRYELRSGDLLLSRSGTIGRVLLLSNLEEPVTYAGYLVRFRPRPSTDPRFLSYVAASQGFQSAIEADAVTSTIQNFNAERYANIRVSAPGLEEQRRIANFLDAETARIDRLATFRSAQIDRLRDRHLAWLQKIFETSKSGTRTRVKYMLRVKPRYGVLVPEFVDDGVPFIRANNLPKINSLNELPMIPRSLSKQYARTVTERNDVLLGVVGNMGKACVVTEELIGANTARAVAVLRLNGRYSPSLFAAWISTAEFERQALLATGADTAQPTLGMEDLANFSLRWPTDATEEKSMELSVEEHHIDMEAALAALERQLTLLAERRQALITAAVTGEIDVTTAGGGTA